LKGVLCARGELVREGGKLLRQFSRGNAFGK